MSKALILKNAAPRFEPQVRITFSTFICASLPHRIIAKRTKAEIIMKAKLLVGFLLTMTLFFILMPTTVSAAAGYEYRDENGQLQSTGDAAVSSMTADTAALSNGWYIVDSNISQYGTIAVSGSVNLILADGYELSVTGSSGSAGILVLEGNSLTIYGQSAGTGKLTVTGGENGAGIGGRDWQLAGTISINGGIIDATGGQYGAGIGGGRSHNGGTTTINGGNVTARGGQDGAGIGGGSNETSYPTLERGSGGTINIKGGNVTAIGNGGGAGIGGGRRGLGGNISISAGNVEATSGDVTSATGGAGIGGGAGKGANNINISGGTVVARALDLGAAVGGGSNGAGGVINISGATLLPQPGMPVRVAAQASAAVIEETAARLPSVTVPFMPGPNMVEQGSAGASAAAAES